MVDVIPTGTVGAPTKPPPGDLDLALAGGDEFISRVSELARAKIEHDRAAGRHRAALEELGLGKSAQEASALAARHLNEAEQQVGDARQKADSIIAAAVVDARRLKEQAEGILEAAKRQADRLVAEAQDHAQGLRDAAGEHHDAAKAARDEAEGNAAEISRLQSDLIEAKAIATESTQRAERLAEKLRGRAALLVDAAHRALED